MNKILFYLLFCPLLLSAQINESDTLKIQASLSLTCFWQEGNVQTTIFRGKTDFSFRPWEKWIFKNQNSYVYQEFGKQKADEDILSLNFLYFHPERKIYPLVLGFVSTNYRREIDLRYLIGAGATFQVVNKNNHWLKFSLTCEYEETDFGKVTFNQAEYNGQGSISTFRSTVWVSGKYHLFDKKMILSHQSYFQPSISDHNNYRWQADIGMQFPIWKYLNFKIDYRHTFESLVISNQKQEDQFLTFGFTLNSY